MEISRERLKNPLVGNLYLWSNHCSIGMVGAYRNLPNKMIFPISTRLSYIYTSKCIVTLLLYLFSFTAGDPSVHITKVRMFHACVSQVLLFYILHMDVCSRPAQHMELIFSYRNLSLCQDL